MQYSEYYDVKKKIHLSVFLEIGKVVPLTFQVSLKTII